MKLSLDLASVNAAIRSLRLHARARVGRDVRVVGRVWIHGGGRVRLGDRVFLDASRGPIELHAEPGAEIELGDDVRLEGGVSIEAVRSVVIEAGAVVGAWTKILDNHFHPLVGDRGTRPRSAPVRIGPGTRIGERCIVLAGTCVEAGASLGHGVVIGRRVPEGVSIEGAPPRRVARREVT